MCADDPDVTDPVDIIKRLLAVIEHGSYPWGKTDEDDKAVAAAEQFVAGTIGGNWWASLHRR